MRQEPIEISTKIDKDPNHLDKLDLLFKEELLESDNISMLDLDKMFVEHCIRSSVRFISDDNYFIQSHGLDLQWLKNKALEQRLTRTGFIQKKVMQDRVTVCFYSGITEATSTSVRIPIYITITFIMEN